MSHIPAAEKAIVFIEDHIREDICVEQVASLTGFSKFHFLRVFKALTENTLASLAVTSPLEIPDGMRWIVGICNCEDTDKCPNGWQVQIRLAAGAADEAENWRRQEVVQEIMEDRSFFRQRKSPARREYCLR